MNWIEFANEYEKVIDEVVSKPNSLTEESEEVIEGRKTIKLLKELPIEKQEVEMSKFKTRQVKELFTKLRA